MLVEFNVENFRSFKDRASLSLVAAKLRSSDAAVDAKTVMKVSDKLSLLRSAVIYGANASGKSNLFKALSFMRRFVRTSASDTQPDDAIPVDPFVLNPRTATQPSTFEVVILIEGLQYRYGFAVDAERVQEEWLYFVPKSHEVELFTRDSKRIHLGRQFSEGHRLDDKTRKNALFLSVVGQFNGEHATKVRSWFAQRCRLVNVLQDQYRQYSLSSVGLGPYANRIQSLIRRLDLDVTHLSVDDGLLPRKVADTTAQAGQTLSVSDRNWFSAVNGISHEVTSRQVKTRHSIRDDAGSIVGSEDFPIDKMESDGTQKLIAIAGTIIGALSTGSVLFADEIDARLHPLLTQALIQLFNSPETNATNAQLICTTHDTNLLDRRLFRRDQFYFVEKDANAASKLYSLADFKIEGPQGGVKAIRNDASFERDYIQGRYGAIPYIGDLQSSLSDHDEQPGATVDSAESTATAVQ